MSLLRMSLVPFPATGRLYRTTMWMVFNDVSIFLIVFVAFILIVGGVCFTVLPWHAGTTLNFNHAFNHPLSTFKALFELAFLGEGLELEFFDDEAANAFLNPLVLQNTPESTSPVLDAWQHLDIVAFVLCYFVCRRPPCRSRRRRRCRRSKRARHRRWRCR